MKFSYENALKIKEKYQHLKGKCFDVEKSLFVSGLLIFPSEPKLHQSYFTKHRLFDNELEHLKSLNADITNVLIYVIHWDEPVFMKIELDEYLTKHNLPKDYS